MTKKGNTETTAISLPPDELAQIREEAKKQRRTVSAFFREMWIYWRESHKPKAIK
jgi:hypothetical protein